MILRLLLDLLALAVVATLVVVVIAAVWYSSPMMVLAIVAGLVGAWAMIRLIDRFA